MNTSKLVFAVKMTLALTHSHSFNLPYYKLQELYTIGFLVVYISMIQKVLVVSLPESLFTMSYTRPVIWDWSLIMGRGEATQWEKSWSDTFFCPPFRSGKTSPPSWFFIYIRKLREERKACQPEVKTKSR